MRVERGGRGRQTGERRLLLWLRARHARTELAWWGWLAGTDIVEERDAVDRIYQLYVVLILAGSTVALWWYVLDGVRTACSAAGGLVADALAAALLLLPVAAFAISALAAASCPVLRLTNADAVYVASGAFSVRALTQVEAMAASFMPFAAMGLSAYVLQVGMAAAQGAPAAMDAAVPVAFGAGAAAAACSVLGRLAGYVRAAVDARRWLLRLVCTGAVEAAALACAAGAARLLLAADAPAVVAALASVPIATTVGALWCWLFALVAVCAVASRAVDMAQVVEENGAYASLYGVRRMAMIAPDTYRDLRRRYRVAHRRFRPTAPFGTGRLAPVARAAQTHLRQAEGLLSLAGIGILLVPFGALVLTARHAALPLLIGWGLSLFLSRAAVLELSCAFRDDQRVRLVRDALPFGTLELAALDGTPALACVLLLAEATLGALSAALPGIVPGGAALTAALLALALALCAALDGVEVPYARRQPSCQWSLLALAVACGLLALWTPAAVMAGLAVVCLVQARRLARGV